MAMLHESSPLTRFSGIKAALVLRALPLSVRKMICIRLSSALPLRERMPSFSIRLMSGDVVFMPKYRLLPISFMVCSSRSQRISSTKYCV